MPDWDAVYCEGWDSAGTAPFGILTTAAAQRRDRAGVQYAVLLLDRGGPVALLHVAWGAGYLGVYLFDEQGRRDREFDYRVLDDPDLLYWRGFRCWRLDPAAAEFADQPWWLRLDIDHHGDATTEWVGNDDGSHATVTRIPPDLRAIRKAPFGSWRSYLDTEALGHGFRAGEPGVAGPVWTPPAPLRPRDIEALFVAGTHLRAGSDGVVRVRAPYDAGLLHLPSGRLVAADPAAYDPTDDALVIDVPPGDYPVSVGWAVVGADDGAEVTAVRVLLDGEPALTWEPALRSGQDTRMLPDGHFFGFDVDSGIGAFFDARDADALTSEFQRIFAVDDPFPATAAPRCFAVSIDDSGTGTNLVAYRSGLGDGSYPVWIGRDAAGRIVSVIAECSWPTTPTRCPRPRRRRPATCPPHGPRPTTPTRPRRPQPT